MTLLIDESPLVILPSLVRAIGANEAIVLQQIHYWLDINKKAKRNYYDGRYWTYNTYDGWHEEFFWLSESTVRRVLAELVRKGLLIKGNYNKSKFDRTNWYTINYDEVNKLLPSAHGEQVGEVTESEPIPETNVTETNDKEIKAQNKVSRKQFVAYLSSLYGEQRVEDMINAVNDYIDVDYPSATKKRHPQEGKYKRAVFAEKLLRCSDDVDTDDEVVIEAMHHIIENYPVEVDPQIYYATGSKVLGNALMATGEICFDQIARTEYDFNF